MSVPLRIHIQESRGSIDGFRVTPERFRSGLAAYPELAGQIEPSFGTDRATLDRGLADAEVLLCGSFESENLEVRAPALRWVQSIFAGVETLVPAIPAGVTLTNGSGVHAPKTTEFALCAFLMLNSDMPRMMADQHRRVWQPRFTPTITGKTVVALGTGQLGSAVAEAAHRLGMRAIGISRSGHPGGPFDAIYPSERLADVLPEADFLVSCLPNTPSTRKMVGPAVFAAMKPGAGFISLGRGQVVDEAALIEALRSGQLGGAVLDVFEVEPLPSESPLWGFDNVVVCAHCGVDDLDSYVPRALALFFDNVGRYLRGEPVVNRVRLELGY